MDSVQKTPCEQAVRQRARDAGGNPSCAAKQQTPRTANLGAGRPSSLARCPAPFQKPPRETSGQVQRGAIFGMPQTGSIMMWRKTTHKATRPASASSSLARPRTLRQRGRRTAGASPPQDAAPSVMTSEELTLCQAGVFYGSVTYLWTGLPRFREAVQGFCCRVQRRDPAIADAGT